MGTGEAQDRAVVEAAQRGDQRAQDELVSAYLPLVYNIVGRALNGHADVDDVVQDTMIRALGGLGSLQDSGRFRSWLVAITMNEIRRHWHKHQAEPASSGLQDANDVADPGVDFVDLTIVRLGLQGQRREVAEATRWLDTDDRALLSLWWLEAAGELSRAEVAAALELSPQHTAVRVQRMKAQLETARVVVRALCESPRCGVLEQVIGVWDGIPSALWRKRIARHARDCTACSGLGTGLVPAEGLLVGLGLVPVVGLLRGFAEVGALGGAGAPGQTVAFGIEGHTGTGTGTGADVGMAYDGTAYDASVPGAAGGPGGRTAVVGTEEGGRLHDRRIRRLRQRRRATVVAAAVALLVTGGTIAGITMLAPDDEPDAVRAASGAGSELATPSAPATSASPSVSPSPSASPSASASPSPSPSKSAVSKPSPTASPSTPRPSKTRPETTKPTPRPAPTPTANPADTPAEQVLAIVNAERAKAGCSAVTMDARLSRAAQLHSEDMSANDYFDHRSQDGRTFGDRAKAQGHPSPGAENIARGQNSPESVMEAWMNSQGHRDNILNCSLSTMGIGVVTDDWTWTQVFGF
ncbi:sigma-70 family RNA polymerase sigma factor [Streptomyces sp. E11-3]|uniref:sigma-70 family RNA polymerase sigma factor n=1 Tax=Streptomyces sp. E11-3 TaxID=3110112 RepID=UPI00397F75C3